MPDDEFVERGAWQLLARAAASKFVVRPSQVNKRKGEEYKLLWKDSPEFVRLALKCNALIVPFAAIGGEFTTLKPEQP